MSLPGNTPAGDVFTSALPSSDGEQVGGLMCSACLIFPPASILGLHTLGRRAAQLPAVLLRHQTEAVTIGPWG